MDDLFHRLFPGKPDKNRDVSSTRASQLFCAARALRSRTPWVRFSRARSSAAIKASAPDASTQNSAYGSSEGSGVETTGRPAARYSKNFIGKTASVVGDFR